MSSQKQEKTFDLVKVSGLTPTQVEHLLLALLCMEKRKSVDWNKLGELCNVTPTSARTVFGKGRRKLEEWKEKRTAAKEAKQAEEVEDDTEDANEADEDGYAENAEN
ncbi:hypothetical protein LT330_002622 [Penicillium expansum]|uniref:Uncharacterized protein n=1 Tax=Penicillium expansum TaxID=27334 RepID=A0A0A2JE22_PENEN|nr:hypothetical protein PEX2_062580 [Penicillium expansum]KAK4862489.1 hypothetical protein LT330_002622 [Penicillium expansum]KGO45104.1 hypothetical protein PEXP_091340 [Penicillium expansum]KGO53647.1 hypothetical protein PEX2_062580 [Penicillium expansum]KGO69891.1 hypothetical protein PEX1_006170 [Penicillium expansum]